MKMMMMTLHMKILEKVTILHNLKTLSTTIILQQEAPHLRRQTKVEVQLRHLMEYLPLEQVHPNYGKSTKTEAGLERLVPLI